MGPRSVLLPEQRCALSNTPYDGNGKRLLIECPQCKRKVMAYGLGKALALRIPNHAPPEILCTNALRVAAHMVRKYEGKATTYCKSAFVILGRYRGFRSATWWSQGLEFEELIVAMKVIRTLPEKGLEYGIFRGTKLVGILKEGGTFEMQKVRRSLRQD